jgi:hypothetical protein
MTRILVTLDIILVIAGFAWPWLAKLGLGRLPGDIVIERDNYRFYFPLTTMILLSLFLSWLLWLFRK